MEKKQCSDVMKLLMTVFMLLSALIVLFLCGCRASGNIQESSSASVHAVRVHDDAYEQRLKADYGSMWMDSLSERMTIRLRIYDTDKGIDSTSGKPPLLAEAEIARNADEHSGFVISGHMDNEDHYVSGDSAVYDGDETGSREYDGDAGMFADFRIYMLVFVIVFVVAGIIIHFNT